MSRSQPPLFGGQGVEMRWELPYHWIRPKRTIHTVNHELYVSAAIDACRRSRGTRVIEVGCGDGWNCARLVEMGYQVVGTDFNDNAVRWASRLVPQASFFHGDLTREGASVLGHESFDIALAVEVLEHIEPSKCGDALRSIRQMVHDRGSLVVTVPSKNMINDNPEHFRHFDRNLLTQTIESSGCWRVQEVFGVGDHRSISAYTRLRPWIDNRWILLRFLESWCFRRYLGRTRVADERCMNLIARAEAC